jgi:RimJ/RimL family protein N-acetyltransferase
MLGYWMATGATGRGLGRQAVEQVVTWARGQEDIATLWALVADANLPSRRVLEVNGFREVGSRGTDERGDRQLVYELELGSRPAA